MPSVWSSPDRPAYPHHALAAVLETALYAADLPSARRFYEEVLGLAPMFADERLAAYAVGASVLLLFQRGTTEQPVRLPGGCIPPHGAQGCQHLALAIAADELDAWVAHLAAADVAIEERPPLHEVLVRSRPVA